MITNLDEQQTLELGIALGQRRAFGMVAGRCSAAHAECLRKIRDEKLFLRFAENWDEYCAHHLKISRRTADRLIALVKELGPQYFELAELTGISAAVYRPIKDAIQDDGIHVDDEIIALVPANADRAIEAVARLQAAAERAEETVPDVSQEIAALEKRGGQLADRFRRVAASGNQFERQWLIDALKRVQQMLARVELEA